MGNNQSNTRTTNYKVFRIARKEEHSDWFRCFLDDYVNYIDGNYMRMDFKDESGMQTAGFVLDILGFNPPDRYPHLNAGDYIEVDLNITRRFSNSHNFSSCSVGKVGTEVVDSEGGVNILALVGGISQDILDARERHAEMVRESYYQNQIVQRQTSLNIPPKW